MNENCNKANKLRVMASNISSLNFVFGLLPGMLGQALPAKLIFESSSSLHQEDNKVATVAFRRLPEFVVLVRPFMSALLKIEGLMLIDP